jgi:hypothetical protein
MGAGACKVFRTGGTIGRLRDNDWVLPDEYISGHHARILFANGAFMIVDTSTNGVFINSSQNRLTRGVPYILRHGDALYIDDYEIRVTLSAEDSTVPTSAPRAPVIPDDPCVGDAPGPTDSANDTDPLALLGRQDARAVPPEPSAANCASQLPKFQHHRPAAWDLDVASKSVSTTGSSGAGRRDKSRIQMTVFGPSQVRRRRPFFLQSVFHLVGEDDKALALARVAEPHSTIAQALPLPGKVREGETINVRLLADSRVSVDESSQTLQWRGDTVAAQFSIELPWLDWRREYLFTVEVDLAGCPVGRCKFRIAVDRGRTESMSTHICGSLSRYHRVFLSYASEDMAVVADLAQLIEIQGMEYSLDKLSLRTGSEWQTELHQQIEKSDLFLLCWSQHAATSKWVAKEIEWALRTQRETRGLRPDIRPFVLDGPPSAPPPRSLRHLHFNSATRFVKQSARQPSQIP